MDERRTNRVADSANYYWTLNREENRSQLKFPYFVKRIVSVLYCVTVLYLPAIDVVQCRSVLCAELAVGAANLSP